MRYAAIIIGLGLVFCAARGDTSLRYLGHHYENTTFTRAEHGIAELRFWCGGNNQYPCGMNTGIRSAAELVAGSLPNGVHLTEKGDIEGTPTEGGDWSGRVKLPGYWVRDSDGNVHEHGDMYVEFHIHVNYYCDNSQC